MLISTTSKSIFVLVIFSSIFVFHTSAQFNPTHHVHIVNFLPNIVKVHCFSGDDELGYHDLKTNQDFQWSFKTTLFRDTKFYSHFWWENKQAGFAVFDSNIAGNYCDQFGYHLCYWEVKHDAFYIAGRLNPSPGDLDKVNS